MAAPLSLQRRQDRIERLLDRAPKSQSPVNPSNAIIDLNLREVIKTDPYVRRVFECRHEILNGVMNLRVPANLVEFFTEYADEINAPAARGITADPDFPYETPPFNGEVARPQAAAYSGGSESVMLDATLTRVDLLRMNHFFPARLMSREFQLALVGMALGYGVLALGTGLRATATARRNYEFTRNWVDLWNEHAYPYTLQYPIGWYTKDATYRFLMLNRFDFVACETLTPEGRECGRCWHCAEKHLYQMALKMGAKGFEGIDPLPLDPAFLRKVQRSNREALKAGPSDPWAVVTEGFKNLERDYGFTLWRTGDPPANAPIWTPGVVPSVGDRIVVGGVPQTVVSVDEVPSNSPTPPPEANSVSAPEQGA